MVDLSAPDPAADLGVLRAELAAYDETLAARPAVIAGTKADLVEDARGRGRRARRRGRGGLVDDRARASTTCSSGSGCSPRRPRRSEAEHQPTVVLRPGRPRFTVVRRADGGWEVSGRSVERWIQETDLEDDREVAQLQTRLKKEGVDRKLAALGAQAGGRRPHQGEGLRVRARRRPGRAVGARGCLTAIACSPRRPPAPSRWPSVLAQIPEDRWAEPTVTPDGWTPIVVAGHMAAWLDECTRVLTRWPTARGIAAAEPEETPASVAAMNAEQAERAAALTRAEAEEAIAAARTRARAAWEALPELTPEAWSWFEESGPEPLREARARPHGLARRRRLATPRSARCCRPTPRPGSRSRSCSRRSIPRSATPTGGPRSTSAITSPGGCGRPPRWSGATRAGVRSTWTR